jgi:phosphoribosylaminoimidazolecarboxamide formyltransferase/IMP cyclohydrolase
MDGRLKTLHPKVFGGILCRHDRSDDMAAIAEHGIDAFELVVVNLYPFESTVARADVGWDEAIEQIDIGGPSLVRAAAKNHQFVTIATSPDQYSAIIDEFTQRKATTIELRLQLAAAAFAHTAAYDRVIADYFANRGDQGAFPATINLTLCRQADLRYGENPHQRAAVYRPAGNSCSSIVTARKLNGKELSYNNLLDLDSALNMARSFTEPAAVVIKHNNPCGLATANDLADAARKAMDGDPVSAFGSVLGFNRSVDKATAQLLCQPGLFIEAIVAPDFDADAVELLTTKPKWKNNVRLLQMGDLSAIGEQRQLRFLDGGVLAQDPDDKADDEDQWRLVTEKEPDDKTKADLRFAWQVVRHVKSNAIVLCKDRMLCGAGAGQMSRVDSVDISIRKAGSRATGSVLGSDAFFPFPDSIQIAAEAGVTAIIQPGGSKRDNEVIDACNQHGLPMIFTERRHFKH